jgi:acetolactate synthase-1/3 small subunit
MGMGLVLYGANVRHTISVLVQNHPGVLARVSGLFSSRGYNIESLAVGETEEDETSRMTIVVSGDDTVLDQIEKQLGKLVEVIKVGDLKASNSFSRELCLVKVKAEGHTRQELFEIANVFRAKVVDVSPSSLTIEVTGNHEKVEGFIELVKTHGILELVRTGSVAIGRGPDKL